MHLNRNEARRAVFFDRDGTLIQEAGFLKSLSEIVILPGAFAAVRSVNQAGMRVIVVTNQSGIARGYLSEGDLDEIHRRIRELFERERARIDAFYHCPHLPQGPVGEYSIRCDCRKPEPGLLIRASREWKLDLSESFVVGDSLRDIEAGRRAGCRTALVLTGYGSTEVEKLKSLPEASTPDCLASDILGAVRWALENSGESRTSSNHRSDR